MDAPAAAAGASPAEAVPSAAAGTVQVRIQVVTHQMTKQWKTKLSMTAGQPTVEVVSKVEEAPRVQAAKPGSCC